MRGRDPAEAAAQARDAVDRGLHEQIDADVAEMLRGKTRVELESLEAEVVKTLDDPDAPETEYWQAVLRRISVSKARAAMKLSAAFTRTTGRPVNANSLAWTGVADEVQDDAQTGGRAPF